MSTVRRLRTISISVIPVLLLGASMLAFAQAPAKPADRGTLRIVVRDVTTHYAVRAQIKLDGPQSFSRETDDAGSLQLPLPRGEYQMEITAPGYRDMRTHATVEPGNTWPIGIMLDPVNPPEEEESREAKLKPDFTLLYGYAVDDGKPVAGVKVRLQHAGDETTTNERGYYELSVPTPPDTAPGLPGIDTLIAQKQGYKSICYRNIIVAGQEVGGALLDMEKGTGTIESDDTHKLMRGLVPPGECFPKATPPSPNQPSGVG